MKLRLRVEIILAAVILWAANSVLSIRFPTELSGSRNVALDRPLRTALFAMGSFWRSEAVFGCLNGVERTAAGYAGGSKPNPEYRKIGDHAECVNIEYDPDIINFQQLLDVFWNNHDSTQVFGQGPDVGNQYRSIIFTTGTEESRLAAASKEREQARSKDRVVTTLIQQLGVFYPAEPQHQKFELQRNPFYMLLIGNMTEDELVKSRLAAKLNGYAAGFCPPKLHMQIGAKIDAIKRKGWPILREF